MQFPLTAIFTKIAQHLLTRTFRSLYFFGHKSNFLKGVTNDLIFSLKAVNADTKHTYYVHHISNTKPFPMFSTARTFLSLSIKVGASS